MLETYRPRAPTQEAMLLDTVRRLARMKAGRVAVRIHFSGLAASNRRDHYLRIATEIFIACVSAFEGQLFTLSNRDLVFIARNASLEALDYAVNRVRMLFTEDHLAHLGDAANEPRFCTFFRLDEDYAGLLADAEKLLEDAERSWRRPELDRSVDPAGLTGPIRPEMLARLESLLEKADLANLMRRQTVCVITEGQPVEPLFEEIYVSIEDLQGVTTPGVDLAANRWLFLHLTGTLDRRVLGTLIRDGVNQARPFSLNLNVATVLSPEFARFEAAIVPQLRGRLVIEMNKIDVFADMGAFLFARDYLHDKGFRLCLDGLTHHTLPYYDRSRLGFDLIKIFWTPGSIDDMKPDLLPSVRSIVMEAGQARTILCRCDSERAIEIGQSLGIVMFQGRFVDYLLNRPGEGAAVF